MLFTHRADTDKGGCIQNSELFAFMDVWKTGRAGMDYLVDAIKFWKGGCT